MSTLALIGICSGLNWGTPMLTSTSLTLPADIYALTFLNPDRVSIVKQGLLRSACNDTLPAMPFSTTYLTKHLSPLPQASASEPSGLNIRIFTLASSESCTNIKPSAPMPKWCRHRSRANSARFSASLGMTEGALASTRMKSFPVACSLQNLMRLPRPARNEAFD